MSNDKQIRITDFGVLMQAKNDIKACESCKYSGQSNCMNITQELCLLGNNYYFKKDETEAKEVKS